MFEISEARAAGGTCPASQKAGVLQLFAEKWDPRRGENKAEKNGMTKASDAFIQSAERL